MCDRKGINTLLRLFVAIVSVLCFSTCDKLPEEVNVIDIPSYYFDNNYLDNRVKVVNDAIAECYGDYETFFWISDIHWEPDLNTRNAPHLIKYISSRTGIKTIFNGGDTANSQVLCKNAIDRLKRAIQSNRVYTVTGNHEINDASRYEEPYDRVADELRGHNTDIVYGDQKKSYFYLDNKDDKIRFIGLSSFGLYMDNKYESGYTAEQLAWFKNTALDVQAGWTIIIFTHTLYDINISSDELIMSLSGANSFIDAIDTYQGKGTIACVLMGHTHRDRIHIGSSGVPYIISASDRHATYQGDINVVRIPGTITEQHFEVVVMDKAKKEIKLFSIGANARDGYDNEAGKEVDVRIVKY